MGARLRRHLLLPPLRPGHAARGDDGRARHRGAAGQGAVRRHLVLLAGAHRARPPRILRDLGTPLLIHQPSYSMLNRWIEGGLLDALEEVGAGCIAFSPLAQGMLTDRYLDGVPRDSRASAGQVAVAGPADRETLTHIRALNDIAPRRGQTPRPAGARLGAARPAGDLGADRGEQRRAARGQPRRARQPRLQRRRAGRDRPLAVDGGINLWHVSSDA